MASQAAARLTHCEVQRTLLASSTLLSGRSSSSSSKRRTETSCSEPLPLRSVSSLQCTAPRIQQVPSPNLQASKKRQSLLRTLHHIVAAACFALKLPKRATKIELVLFADLLQAKGIRHFHFEIMLFGWLVQTAQSRGCKCHKLGACRRMHQDLPTC